MIWSSLIGVGKRFLFAVTLTCSGARLASAAMQIEAAQVSAIATLLPPKPAGFGRPIADRAAWKRLAQSGAFDEVVSNAEEMAKEPVAALPDDLYLDFSRTGNRDRCQKVLFARSARLTTLALAECLEARGRFLRPLTNTIEALCSERTWVYPAHDGGLKNFYGRTIEMDLRATAVAWELATAEYLLGERLAPETRRQIRENIHKRVLQPFRDMVEGRRNEIHWLRATHNWNAVCLAGVTGAALAIEDAPADRAWFVAAAQRYIRFFLGGFTPDGYCSEGIGYWSYGFGHFLMLGEAIRQATGNRVDLLADPAALQPALFCIRSEIINNIYPTISDCHPGSRPAPQFVRFLGERLRQQTPDQGEAEFMRPSGSLTSTMMFSFLAKPLPVVPNATRALDSPLRSWFKDGGVLICRPSPGSGTPFAAVLKGGHNAEHHNHNDVGSFSLVAGKTMVVCDPGGEVYTARTFGPHRYDSKVLSSYGHAVPVVAGQLQRTGSDARAVVRRADFSDDEDTLALDLRSAYRAPQLERLERTFVFRRKEPASLTVRDEVSFGQPESFETALVTWGKWKKLSGQELSITEGRDAVRVRINTGGLPFEIAAEELKEDVRTPKKPVRLAIALKAPVKEAVVTLTIEPISKSARAAR